MLRVRALAGLLLLTLLGSACQADADVTVDAAQDGSGTVTVEVVLDAEAAAGLLELSDTGLSLNDLAQSGWEIEPPTEQDDGRTVLGGSKPFGNPQQFADIMTELTGPEGMFSDLRLRRDKSFGRVDFSLDGNLVADGFESFSDPDLEAALGSTLSDVAADYGAAPEDVSVQLMATLPGNLDGDAVVTGTSVSRAADADGPAVTTRAWTINLSAEEPVAVAMSSVSRNMAPLVLRGLAALAVVLAAVLVLGQLLGLFSSSSSKPKKPIKKVSQGNEELSGGEPTDEPVGPAVVAIDGMGVLYRNGRDTAEVLVPFLRELGVSTPTEEIKDKTRQLSLGRITPGDFWSSFGLTADPNSLDEAYLARHQLTPGVVRFLRETRASGVVLACISNDCTEWATKLRSRHSLNGLIDTWVVSGSVGVRKPDKPIFEVLRRIVGHPPEEILIVDDELYILDAAREQGFQTMWFPGDGVEVTEDSRGHKILASFAVTQPTT